MLKKLNLLGGKQEKILEQPYKKGMATINRYKCGYCGTCVGVCPVKTGALELIETWVEVDADMCTGCGICAKICPVGAIEITKTA